MVDSVSDQYNLLENQIYQGYAITGFYVYDSSTPNSSPWPLYEGSYLYTTAPYGMSLTVGGVTFQTDPLNTRFLVGIANDNQGNDSYSVISYNNLALGMNVLLNPLSWGLTDNLGIAISSTDLPVLPPDLSRWPFNNLYILGGTGGTAPCYDKPFWINGHVTSDYLIPEPASLCLLAFGELFLRKKIVKNSSFKS